MYVLEITKVKDPNFFWTLKNFYFLMKILIFLST